MKERNDWIIFNLGLLVGIIGLFVVAFVNHGVVALGLEGLLINKLGRSLFAWATRFGSDRGGPQLLNNSVNKLLFLLTSIAMTWGGLAMMWFANQLATYAFIAYSLIRGAIEGYLERNLERHLGASNTASDGDGDAEAVNQIVGTYKKITARYPNAPEDTVLDYTVREVLADWNATSEPVKLTFQKNTLTDIHEVVNHLMSVREQLATSDNKSQEFSKLPNRSIGSDSWRMQVNSILKRP